MPDGEYKTGIKCPPGWEEERTRRVERDELLADWNYVIRPSWNQSVGLIVSAILGKNPFISRLRTGRERAGLTFKLVCIIAAHNHSNIVPGVF